MSTCQFQWINNFSAGRGRNKWFLPKTLEIKGVWKVGLNKGAVHEGKLRLQFSYCTCCSFWKDTGGGRTGIIGMSPKRKRPLKEIKDIINRWQENNIGSFKINDGIKVNPDKYCKFLYMRGTRRNKETLS